MSQGLVRPALAVISLAGALTLVGCFSSDNEVHYEGPHEEFVNACRRALETSQAVYGERQIVEHVTVSDPDQRYPIATGELLVLRNSGGNVRYHWTCQVPHGDDYLAARIKSLTQID